MFAAVKCGPSALLSELQPALFPRDDVSKLLELDIVRRGEERERKEQPLLTLLPQLRQLPPSRGHIVAQSNL